ncbi:MAG: hypothetical protein Q9224_007088 [Gallowayella concinna]
MMQLVFQVDGDLDTSLVCRAFEAIHDGNEAFRSRFVEVDGEMQTVVTNMPVAWSEADNLERYTEEDRNMKMTFGQPTVRYALVEEKEKTYIVWTALHTAMDNWTRKLLCDDLEACLQDPTGFSEKPRRPSVRKYLDFVAKMDPTPSQSYWREYLAGNPRHSPPLTTSPKLDEPICNKKMVKRLPIQAYPRTSIRLSTMAYTAFALLVGSISGYEDMVFWGGRGSRTVFPGAEAIMGSLVSSAPFRVSYQASDAVQDLLQRVQQDANTMMRHEPWALLVRPELDVLRDRTILLNWYYKGTDLTVRSMRGKVESDAKEATLKVVEEVYSPHPVSGVVNAYDNGDHLKLSAEYDDRLFSDEFMEIFTQRFSDMLNCVCQCKGEEQVKALLHNEWQLHFPENS